MGNSPSSPDTDAINQLLKKESPLQWTVDEVINWLILNCIDNNIIEFVKNNLIDGECICEINDDIFISWMNTNNLSKKQQESFLNLLSSQVRSHEMVTAFQTTEENKIIDFSDSHSPINNDNFTIESANDLIKIYHDYTKNSSKGGAPTVKRVWAYQPKITRRYYNTNIIHLEKKPKNTSIDKILYYSLNVSAYQTSDQKLMYPRTMSSKRVNPSSGGLHPVESYVIMNYNNSLTIGHYSPLNHALEIRSIIKNDIKLPTNSYIIGISTVLWREVWKYGPRGWRYTQLDVGHAIASIAIACKLCDYEIKVLDGSLIPSCDSILALDLINEKANEINDPRETEHVMTYLLLTPCCDNNDTLNNTFNTLNTCLTSILNSKKDRKDFGIPNVVFNRAKNPVLWPYISAIENATSIKSENINECYSSTTKIEYKNCSSFPSNSSLQKVVRVRRSVINFQQKNISLKVMESCLSSCLVNINSILSILGNNFIGEKRENRYYSNIHFGLWITGVKNMKNGKYFLLRDNSDEILKSFENNNILLEKCDNLSNDKLNLYYIIEKEEENNNNDDIKDKTNKNPQDFKDEASTISCYQNIAKDCSVVIAMFAPINQSIVQQPRNYQYLHWEAGILGQMLYIQAYNQGIGATGMGCYLDDECTEIFKVSNILLPLYHFAFGIPVKDKRFSTLL